MLIIKRTGRLPAPEVLHQKMNLFGPAHVDGPVAGQISSDSLVNLRCVLIRELLDRRHATISLREGGLGLLREPS
jgi:hypothetical protein